MILLFIGIILGLIIKPIIYTFVTRLIFPLPKKVPRAHIKNSSTAFLTPIQEKICVSSLHQCTDTAWINLIVQRYWVEAQESYCFQERIKTLLLKKVAPFVQYKLIKQIRILKMDFGREAPYIDSTKVLTKEQFHDFVLEYGMSGEMEENLDAEESGIYWDVFRNVLILVDLKYSGTFTAHVKLELAGGINYELIITVNSFDMKAIVRLPSVSHNTRVDVTHLNYPKVEISVEPLVRNENEPIKNFTIRYIKKVLSYALNNSAKYPVWTTLFLPLVMPSTKDIIHKTVKITPSNFKEVSDNFVHLISLYASMDYKIIKKSERFVKRRIQYFINDSHRIFRYEFPVPKKMTQLKQLNFEKLDDNKASVLSHFYDLAILKGLFKNFVGVKSMVSYTQNVSLVVIYFTEISYQFMRIQTPNGIIFQSNSEDSPEFFSFNIVENMFYVHQFGLDPNLIFTDQRIVKIIKKMEGEAFKILGSEALHSIYEFSKTKATQYFHTPLIFPDMTAVEVENLDLLSAFSHLERKMDPNESFYSFKKLVFKSDINDFMTILLNDECRYQLIAQNFSIFGQTRLDDQVYSSIITVNSNDVVIHTFARDFTVIDTEVGGTKNVRGFKVRPVADHVELELYSRPKISVLNFTNFITHVNLLLRHLEITKQAETKELQETKWTEIYERSFSCAHGAVYIEFFIKSDSPVVLTASKNIKQNYILNKVLISPNTTSKLLISTEQLDTLLFTFKSKSSYLVCLSTKMVQLPIKFRNDEMFDLDITLEPKAESTIPINGKEKNIIFWRNPNNSNVTSTLSNETDSVELTNFGMIPSYSVCHNFMFKNCSNLRTTCKIFLGMANVKDF